MTVLPADMFVQPIEGHDDLFKFRYDFSLEGKAVEGASPQPVVTETEDGDLIIEGYAAVWEGDDRQGENFAPGAFANGIQKFLNGQAALCYHHQHDKCLGKVLDLREEGKGLKMKARVDFQPENSPLRYIYNGIKKGTYNGLSTFGYFTRGLVERAQKIMDVDLTEISITPVPVHPGTSLSVVAGKALDSTDEPAATAATTEFDAFGPVIDRLTTVLDGLHAKALPSKHDPKDARFLSDLLAFVGRARQIAGIGRDDTNDEELIALADEIETVGAKWEATAHRIAAKIGPLPPTSGF